MVADPETRKPCKRQVFLFEQLMIFSEPFERKLDWTVYIYRHSIKVTRLDNLPLRAESPSIFLGTTSRSPLPDQVWVIWKFRRFEGFPPPDQQIGWSEFPFGNNGIMKIFFLNFKFACGVFIFKYETINEGQS